MCCYDREEWMVYLYGEISETEAEEMEKHLEMCVECREEIRWWLQAEMEIMECRKQKVKEIVHDKGCIETETLCVYAGEIPEEKLSEREQKEIEQHLRICPSCREDLKIIKKFPRPEKIPDEILIDEEVDGLLRRLQALYYL